MNSKSKQTVKELIGFYIDHMVESAYGGDWDKFWEHHEDIIELETEINKD